MKSIGLARPLRAAPIDQQAQAASLYPGTYIPLEDLRVWTGMGISSEAALNYIAVYQCVRVLSNVFAQLPLKVYRRVGANGREEAFDHPLYPVLHDAPNPDMTSFVWRKMLARHVLTWGNHYSEKVYDFAGRLQLWPIRPDHIEPRYARGDEPLYGLERTASPGEKVFRYSGYGGEYAYLPASRILHLQGQTSDGLAGSSPIGELRATLGLANSAERFGRGLFDNNARPGTVLTHPATLSPAAIGRLSAQMDEMRGGGNNNKTVVLEEGLTVTPIGFPPEDAQFLETRLLQHRLLYGAYGVPPHKVGDLERATFSNIEHQALEFIQDGAMPWLVNAEMEFDHQLIEEDDVFAEFLVDGYLRGDSKTRAETFAIRWQHGTLSPDEWRAKENENPIAGGSGETYYVPANYIPAGAAAAPPAAEPAAQEGPPALFAVRSAAGLAELRCPDDGKLILRLAAPGSVGDCPKCKREVRAEPTRSVGLDDTVAGLRAAIRTLGQPPSVNVEPPNVSVAAPIVDTGPIADAMNDLRAEFTSAFRELARPRKVVRDDAGKIMGTEPG